MTKVPSHPGEGATDSVWAGISEALGTVTGDPIAADSPPGPVDESPSAAPAAVSPADDPSPSAADETVPDSSRQMARDSNAAQTSPKAEAEELVAAAEQGNLGDVVPEAAAAAAEGTADASGGSRQRVNEDEASAAKVDESASACKQS